MSKSINFTTHIIIKFDSIHNTLTNKKYINSIQISFASQVKIRRKKITHKPRTAPKTNTCTAMSSTPSPSGVTVVVAPAPAPCAAAPSAASPCAGVARRARAVRLQWGQGHASRLAPGSRGAPYATCVGDSTCERGEICYYDSPNNALCYYRTPNVNIVIIGF
jgi:hypothetical protein